MHPTKLLASFFEKAISDSVLNSTHISLYVAILQSYTHSHSKNPVSISRDDLMLLSKIGSRATYHKCISALHERGYINYRPTRNPFKSSQVSLLKI